ncbi:hypothetical protein DMN91_008047 [Ooceraea biroi]|uniref:Peptidase S8 pro-domain domain-containing protein n=1 Tax=Ooceraea biroi TaxID=2015173 RepID=A0A3L8DGC4_OOCBI|nr:hypothetical protein DMN91_008047 [Ooceraea biroi]
MIFRVTLLIVCALLAGVISEPRPRPRPVPIYSNQFAVYVPSGLEAADEIAQEHGFDNHGQDITARMLELPVFPINLLALLSTSFNLNISGMPAKTIVCGSLFTAHEKQEDIVG